MAEDTPRRKRIGEILVESGVVTLADVEEAASESERLDQYIGHTLIRMGRLSREELGKALSSQIGVKYVSLSQFDVDLDLVELLPEAFITSKRVFPIAKEAGRLIVAMVEPLDRATQDEITFITGMRPQVVVTTSVEFQEACREYLGGRQESSGSLLEELSSMTGDAQGGGASKALTSISPQRQSVETSESVSAPVSKSTFVPLKPLLNEAPSASGALNTSPRHIKEKPQRVSRQPSSSSSVKPAIGSLETVSFSSSDSNPLVALVDSVFEHAIQTEASDIHVEPRYGQSVVRFRCNGLLGTATHISEEMEAGFVTRVKVMARMDIAEHRRPQDGRFTYTYQGLNYNFRVNSLPVMNGREKLAIRILRPFGQVAEFSELGLNLDDARLLKRLYQEPHGIILVCGPTGSGKTTTLYTALNDLNNDACNINTVEDPIELVIDGINQTQVNAKAGYTFSSSVRALLRQDPDVIMLGEIRDYETLESSIQAALTGHLVLSTIHANTAAATITRMIEMGAPVNLLTSSVVGIVAQRLVRKLCPNCKKLYRASLDERKQLFPFGDVDSTADLALYHHVGCEQCDGSGYDGRVGIFEIMHLDREICQLLSNKASELEIEDAAVSSGMRTLTMSARQKVVQGLTTMEELVRVLGAGLGG